MPHFERRLKTDQGYLTFYFNRIYTAAGTRYHISVNDKEGKVLFFNMQEQEGRWHLATPSNCPPWLIEMAKTFEEEILKHLKEGK